VSILETERVFERKTIGLSDELGRFEHWLTDPKAVTELWSVSGIGGIGKTTLLMEMAKTAKRHSVLALWADGLGEMTASGALLTNLETGLESETGRTRAAGAPLLAHIVKELSNEKTVLLIDNGERFDRMEGWFLSVFLPPLEASQVLIVIASRKGLPPQWHARPDMKRRMRAFPLKPFTREQVLDYLNRTGLPPDLQAAIARQSEGHPLQLALTADLLLPDRGDSVPKDVSGHISAEWLKEAAAPDMYEKLTAMSLLPYADQPLLGSLLDGEADAADYFALGRLSFVNRTDRGLVLHSVVSSLLRQEYVRRNPEEFDERRLRAFRLLAERFRREDKQGQMMIAAHVLELYRERLPQAMAYADFATALKPGESLPYQPSDLPHLQRMLAVSAAQSDWQSELVLAENYPRLLEDIAMHGPEGIFVVRDEQGRPVAFCAGVWLHEPSLRLLERYAPAFRQVWGFEGDDADAECSPSEAADTIFVLLAAVDVRQSLYRPEELGALLMRRWLAEMACGFKGCIVSGDPHLNALLSVLGFRKEGELRGYGVPGLSRWEIDFRHVAFERWMRTIISQTETARSAGGMPPISAAEEGKRVLELLFEPERLRQLPAARRLLRKGQDLREEVMHILTAGTPPPPLTRQEQQLLKDRYLLKDRNLNELAEHYHMSRTTLYRHVRLVAEHLWQALGTRME